MKTPILVALFLVTSTLYAAEPSRYTGRVSDHDINARIEDGPNGPEFVLTYTNPEKLKLEAWRVARQTKESRTTFEAQQGYRAAWRQDKAPIPETFSVRLNYNRGFDENWKQMQLIDPEVMDKPEVKKLFTKFVQRTEKQFKALDNSRTSYGTTLAYLEAHRTPPGRRTQQQKEAIRKHFKGLDESTLEAPLPLKRTADFSLNSHALLAVHNELGYDPCKSTEAELNKLVEAFKQHRNPVIFLASDGHRRKGSWIGTRRDADHVIYSGGGEHDIPVTASEVTITGGYLNNCLNRAMQETTRQHFRSSRSDFTINIPLAASFSRAPKGGCPVNLDAVRKLIGTDELVRFLVSEDPDVPGMPANLFGDGQFGRLDPSEYTVEVFVDGRLADTQPKSRGPKKIRLQLWSGGKHPLMRNSGPVYAADEAVSPAAR